MPPNQKQAVQKQLAQTSGIDSGKTLVNTVVPQVYPILIAGRDLNTVLRSVSKTDKINARDIVGDLTDLQGFDLSGGRNNLPTIILRTGRNLQAADAGTNAVILSSELEQNPVNLRLADTIVVQSADGTVTRVLKWLVSMIARLRRATLTSILADASLANKLGGSQTLEVFSLRVDPNQVPALKKHVNTACSHRLFVCGYRYVSEPGSQQSDHYASHPCFAGDGSRSYLIANAVALAMLERRREIGILNIFWTYQ